MLPWLLAQILKPRRFVGHTCAIRDNHETGNRSIVQYSRIDAPIAYGILAPDPVSMRRLIDTDNNARRGQG